MSLVTIFQIPKCTLRHLCFLVMATSTNIQVSYQSSTNFRKKLFNRKFIIWRSYSQTSFWSLLQFMIWFQLKIRLKLIYYSTSFDSKFWVASYLTCTKLSNCQINHKLHIEIEKKNKQRDQLHPEKKIMISSQMGEIVL